MKSKSADQGKDYKDLYDALKSQSLEDHAIISNLQNQNATLSHQNKSLSIDLHNLREKQGQEIGNLKFHISLLEDRNKELIIERREIEIKFDTMRISNHSIMQEHQEYREFKDREVEELKRKYSQDKNQFNSTFLEYKQAIEDHQKVVSENEELSHTIVREKEHFRNEIANKERQKMQTIDNIKTDMMKRAYQMRNKAMEIRREQLDTTTRITYLQNDQLIRELEYQSFETQKVLHQNQQLENTIKELKNKLQIHETVEKQFARRNFLAKNMIKKISQKQKQQTPTPNQEGNIQNIEADKVNIQWERKLENCDQNKFLKKKNAENKENYKTTNTINRQKTHIQELTIANQSLANQLKKVKQTNETLKKQKKAFEDRFIEGGNHVLNILVKFYQKNKSAEKTNEEFDLENLKHKAVEDWTDSEVAKCLRILLEAIQSDLGLKLLRHPYFKEKQKMKMDFESVKENLNVSRYIEGLKRRNHRSLYNKTMSLHEDKLRSNWECMSLQKIKENIGWRERKRSLEVKENREGSDHINEGIKKGKMKWALPVAQRFMKPQYSHKV